MNKTKLEDIENKAIELLDEVKRLKEIPDKIERGDIVNVAGHEWVVLKVDGDNVHCLHKELMPDKEFDKFFNNWIPSDLRHYLNTVFLMEIKNCIGKENIVSQTTDLTSLDGQKEYREICEYVSLPTLDMYRENRDIIPNAKKCWWLVTPWTTSCNDNYHASCTVSSDGNVIINNCYSSHAVRPFCIFKSSIF